MRLYIKLGLWIVLCSVLGSCRIEYPYGITPDMLFCFTVAFAVMCADYRKVYAVTLVCAAVSAALSGVPMLYCVALFGLAGTIMNELPYNKLKRNVIFVMLYTAAFMLAGETVLYYIMDISAGSLAEAMRTVILPVTVCSGITAAAVYAGVYLTFGEKRKKTMYIKVV